MTIKEAADICREAEKIASRMDGRFVLDKEKLGWAGFSSQQIDEMIVLLSGH